jgi:hypothetical protein
MKASLLGPSSAVAMLAAVAVGACSATSGPNGFTAGNGASASTGTQGNGGMPTTGSSNGGNPNLTTSGTGTTSSGGTFSAYAHTNTTLFKMDPSQANLALTMIGNFTCIGGNGQDTSMTDLAVNDTGDLWAISAHNVYKLQLPAGGTGPVSCVQTIQLGAASTATFYGLTFAPAGLLGPNEVLVGGNTAGQLWAIDVTNPQMPILTQHGTFGPVPANDGHGHNYQYAGKEWELSGDIVFLANNGNPLGFATVRDCPNPPSSSNCDTTDTLIELDLNALKTAGTQVVTKNPGGVRGAVVKAPTCNDPANQSYGSMYGIAAYQDKVYGFSHQGYVVTISNNDGTACLALQTSGDSWAGAAISTVAPVKPPTTQ